MESNGSGEIFIQNSDSALGIISWKSVLTFKLVGVIKLNYELKIWVPFFVINNWDSNLLLGVSLTEFNNFINVSVVSWGLSSVVNGSYTNSDLLAEDFLYNSNFNVAITLSD